MKKLTLQLVGIISLLASTSWAEDIAVQGETIHTMAGEPIRDGVVLIKDGKIQSVGPSASVKPVSSP